MNQQVFTFPAPPQAPSLLSSLDAAVKRVQYAYLLETGDGRISFELHSDGAPVIGHGDTVEQAIAAALEEA